MATPFLSAEEYDERAHQLYSEGQYDEALGVLREGLALYPNSVTWLISNLLFQSSILLTAFVFLSFPTGHLRARTDRILMGIAVVDGALCPGLCGVMRWSPRHRRSCRLGASAARRRELPGRCRAA